MGFFKLICIHKNYEYICLYTLYVFVFLHFDFYAESHTQGTTRIPTSSRIYRTK